MTKPIPKLFPCPVCGKAPKVLVRTYSRWHSVDCRAAKPNIWHDVGAQGRTAKVAAERWNKLVGKKEQKP